MRLITENCEISLHACAYFSWESILHEAPFLVLSIYCVSHTVCYETNNYSHTRTRNHSSWLAAMAVSDTTMLHIEIPSLHSHLNIYKSSRS